jgi:formate dehydrogenase subunit gamma
MRSVLRRLMQAAALAVTLALPAAVLAQAASAAAPSALVAPAEPKVDESNAVRAKTQPGNNAPFWRAVRDSGAQAGTTNLPGAEKGVLVQSFVQYPGSMYTTAGEAWRQVRNRWLVPYGGALLLIVAAAIVLFHFTKGRLGEHGGGAGDTGRRIERFTPFERAAHWSNAIAFVVLAISGIVMAWGKFFLLPILGATLFGWLAYALKTAHNFAGPLFAVSLVIVFFTFVRDNFWRREDTQWLAKGGGLLKGHEPASQRFNGGEKLIFWLGVLLLGSVVVVSGLVLDGLVPGWGDTRGQMQVAHMVHATAAVLMMAMFMGHIYIGTLGMKGAFSAMRTGYVDEAWAHEHHALWAEDVRTGRIPAQRSNAQADLRPAKEGT